MKNIASSNFFMPAIKDMAAPIVARFPSEGNLSVPVQESANSYNPGTYGERLYVQTRLARSSYFKP